MATERIDVVVSERGSRTVKRNIENVGDGALKAHSAVSLLKRALLGLGIGFTLTQTIGTLASFSQAMATVRAITGATEGQFQTLREEVKRLGSETRFSASQAAEGAQFLARAGFDTSQVMASLGQTLTLAQAGALDLGTAADIASNVLTSFRIEAEESGRVVDVLAFAANRGNTNVMQLGDALKFVAPIAAGLGVSLEETTAAATALSDAGLQASLAGTGLRRILSELESPASKTRGILRSLGISTDDVRVSQVGLTEAMIRLRDAGVDTGLALEIFGDRGGPAFEVLSQSIPKVQALNKELQNSSGFAAEVSKVMDDNLNGALLATRSALEALVIAFGDLGSESFLTGLFRGLATAVRSLAANLDDLLNATLAYGPIAVFVFRRQVAGAIMAATRATIAFTVAIARNPIGLLAVAISSVVAALIFFKDEIQIGTGRLANLRDLGIATFEALSDAFSPFVQAVSEGLTFITGLFGTSFDDIELSIEGVLRVTARVVDGIVGFFKGAADAIEIAFSNIPAALEIIFVRAFNTLAQLNASFINVIIDGINVIRDFAGKAALAAFEPALLTASQEGQLLGERIDKAIADGINNQNAAENALDGILARAEEIANNRLFAASLQEIDVVSQQSATGLRGPTPVGGGGEQASAELQDFLLSLEREGQLLRLNNDERRIQEALFRAESAAKRDLTETEKGLITSLVTQNAELEKQRGLIENIIDTSGLIENTIVNAFKGAEDAIVDFARTGKLSFGGLVDSIISDLARLAARQAIIGPLAGALGIGGSGGGGGFNLFNSLSTLFSSGAGSTSIPAFANGGSGILGGNGGVDRNTLSLNGKPIARVSRGERMTITPQGAGQSGSQRPIQVTVVVQGVTDAKSFLDNTGAISANIARQLELANRRNN